MAALELLKAYARLDWAAEAQLAALEEADWEGFEANSLLRNEAFEALVALEGHKGELGEEGEAAARAHIAHIAQLDRQLEQVLAALAAATSSEMSKLQQGIHALQAYTENPEHIARFLDTVQ